MTTITREKFYDCAIVYVVRSTDLHRTEGFRSLGDAIAYCRHIGLPYYVNA